MEPVVYNPKKHHWLIRRIFEGSLDEVIEDIVSFQKECQYGGTLTAWESEIVLEGFRDKTPEEIKKERAKFRAANKTKKDREKAKAAKEIEAMRKKYPDLFE